MSSCASRRVGDSVKEDHLLGLYQHGPLKAPCYLHVCIHGYLYNLDVHNAMAPRPPPPL